MDAAILTRLFLKSYKLNAHVIGLFLRQRTCPIYFIWWLFAHISCVSDEKYNNPAF